jgi:hypothetical protein
MEYVFRQMTGDDGAAPHEVLVRPHIRHFDSCRMAALALERGVDGVIQGDGAIERIVIQKDPTLDDMLAAFFLERQLAKQEIPASAADFAAYAALAREGLKPGDLPLKDSLAGIYLAIRHNAGEDLCDEVTRIKFLADWSQMADRIARAMANGQNPFTTPLFGGDAAFARAQAFLAEDREVYEHQDVPRGGRWLGRIPGGPARRLGGLTLSIPRSVLWKFWSREDPKAPGGRGYPFLAVFEKPHHWRFSTNPALKLPSLQPLAANLQKAEAAKDPLAEKDPWYDGKRHSFTLIAAPNGGTKLSDRHVLRIAKRWLRARPLWWNRRTAAVVCMALVAVLVTVDFGSYRRMSRAIARGLGLGEDTRSPSPYGPHDKPNLYLLTIGVSRYKDADFDLNYADDDAEELFTALAGQREVFHDIPHKKCLVNDEATKSDIVKAFEELQDHAKVAAEHDLVIIALSGHGRRYRDKYFCFLPHDFDTKNQLDTSITWDDMKKTLDGLPCLVVVLMDTITAFTSTARITSLVRRWLTHSM